jgi:hypothetical protein
MGVLPIPNVVYFLEIGEQLTSSLLDGPEVTEPYDKKNTPTAKGLFAMLRRF